MWFLRDYFVFILPLKRLPRVLVKLFYGVNPEFIFFVHARRREDIYIARPFLVLFRRVWGRKRFLRIIKYFPPFVLDTIRVRQNGKTIEGLVVTSKFLPEILLQNNKESLKESFRGLFFVTKICSEGTVMGLGGLWPMVTRRGLALTKHAEQRGIKITNGHCGTLVSLYLTIEKLASISDIPFDGLKVAILGAGKMGTNLARALYGKVATLTLVDINDVRLNRVEENLKSVTSKTDIQRFNNREDVGGITKVLESNHITVSTTSNLTRILRPEQIPKDSIIIDDSRPEGIPREISSQGAIVLEGGLMKIQNIEQYYDFGFGVDENVFGCLAESFMLVADKTQKISPTLGEVDFTNFNNMLSICNRLGVSVGDFKCRDEYVSEKKLISMLNNKKNLSATIPFKNVCWIFKVDDLYSISS